MADLKHKLKKYKAYLEAHPHGDKVSIALDLQSIIPCIVFFLYFAYLIGKLFTPQKPAEPF